MKLNKVLIGIMLMLVLGVPVQADEFSSGLHGMQWASPIADHPGLVKVHENNLASYYTDAETIYQLSETQVDRVLYGFYQGRLFAGFIDLSDPLQFVNLKRHFTTRYGAPKITSSADNELTIYRWKTGAIKIKLKHKRARNETKMAIYFSPLSEKLNEAQVEQLPSSKAGVQPAGKGYRPKTAPLFNF